MRTMNKATCLTILPDPPPPPTAIGLIAGGGQLPVLVAQGLRRAGHPVHGLGLFRQYSEELPPLCASFREVGLFRVGSWGRILSRMGIRHAIMVGKVDKARLMHDPFKLLRYIPDFRTAVRWYRDLRHDRRSHAVLAAIAHELERDGVSLLDSTMPIPDQLAAPGVMTRKTPSAEERADIDFVWPLLTQLLRLDVGQAVAVRDRDVIAVEAVEGTDAMIERVEALCRGRPWTLCKGARSGHDRRSDVPTVGPTTIERLAAAGGTCLALSVDDVIMLEKDAMIEAADRAGVAVVGVPAAPL